eukprot:TRINITY_DN2110_c0_g1_i12.p1 TRINITY_DN2110_c0_g1~~TRINITY_DN2110_c0_g1_i12.p1  ORF type:complete len:230 (+),score=34.09 TRINITY_DN2110_c0_g1_i12:158-847(+)
MGIHFKLAGKMAAFTSYSYLFKFIVIGDWSVGKSCLLMRFIENTFRDDCETTIGVEFGARYLKVQEKTIKLQIWDTAGQESFRSITRSYYRGSIGALLIYDVTRRETFESCERWLEDARTYGNDNQNVMLIGNKSDMTECREVTTEEGRSFALRNNILFEETSAKEGTNVEMAFSLLCEAILSKIKSGAIDPANEANGIRAGSIVPKTLSLEKEDTEDKNKDNCLCPKF